MRWDILSTEILALNHDPLPNVANFRMLRPAEPLDFDTREDFRQAIIRAEVDW